MGDGDGVGNSDAEHRALPYNTATFAKNGWAAPDSWTAPARRKRYRHRIGPPAFDASLSFTYYALMMLGGGKPDDVPAGIKALATNKDCIDSFDSNAGQTIQKAQLGDTDIGVLAHQLVITLAAKGAPLAFVNPKEGAILQFSTAAVTKGAPHPELAQILVNEMLSERVQRVLVQEFSVSPVNPAVTVPPELIAKGAPDPAHMDRYITINAEQIAPNRRRYIEDSIRVLAQ